MDDFRRCQAKLGVTCSCCLVFGHGNKRDRRLNRMARRRLKHSDRIFTCYWWDY